jgi:hypothetical protein
LPNTPLVFVDPKADESNGGFGRHFFCRFSEPSGFPMTYWQ